MYSVDSNDDDIGIIESKMEKLGDGFEKTSIVNE